MAIIHTKNQAKGKTRLAVQLNTAIKTTVTIMGKKAIKVSKVGHLRSGFYTIITVCHGIFYLNLLMKLFAL